MPDRRSRPAQPAPAGAVTSASPAGEAALLPPRTLSGLLPGVRAGFSTALPRVADDALAPLLRELTARAWGVSPEAVPAPLLLRQTHSPDVLALDDPPPGPEAGSPPADGAMAADATPRLLAVKTADCVPLLAVDPATGRYAALHAGWRGTAAGILRDLLATWRDAGSDLAGVRLELGPHIQGCCYEVQADCLAHFAPEALAGDAVRRVADRTYLHLAAVLRHEALQAGVPAAHVHVWEHCTDCHRDAAGEPPYASYRRGNREGTGFTGTNVGLIGVPGEAP